MAFMKILIHLSCYKPAMQRLYAFSLCVLFVISFKSVYAQRRVDNELGFRNDNDVYLMKSQDEYYTNGISLFYKRAIDSTRFSTELWENKLWSIGIGHKIYNAYTGDIESENEIDRPITGYLYVNGEMHWYSEREEALSLGMELAVIGKRAFGEDVQRGFHQLFGFYEINGWQYQLNNAIGFDARASYSRLLFRNRGKHLDVFVSTAASVGMNNTRLSVGPNIRFGRINPLFESAAMGSRVQSGNNKPDRELYFFYRPQLSWVTYNSTIQGGLLSGYGQAVTFDIKPFVFSHVIGFQVAMDRIGLNLNYIHTTREVVDQRRTHAYGSLGMTYYF